MVPAQRRLRLGLIVNPVSGLGGAAGLKGSDGEAIQAAARKAGGVPRAGVRVQRFFAALGDVGSMIDWIVAPGCMGQEHVVDVPVTVMGSIHPPTLAADTTRLAAAMVACGVDLIVFAGGDGTAIDIYRGVGERQAVLGIPAGVKMHSGVYANTPEDAAAIVRLLVEKGWTNVELAEVRDIDEASFRANRVVTRHFGDLLVPRDARWLQAVKCSGREQEPLVLEEIAAWLRETREDYPLEIIGPGSTTAAYVQSLGVGGSLLGVDVLLHGALLARDQSADQLVQILQEHAATPARIVVTPIPGQGHILGRGNQQISPDVIRLVGAEHIWVIATRSKIAELGGRPLLVDIDEPGLLGAFPPTVTVLCGYNDHILVPLRGAAEQPSPLRST